MFNVTSFKKVIGFFTWQSTKNLKREGYPWCAEVFKLLPVPFLFLFHWQKQIMWPSAESTWERTTQGCGYRDLWQIVKCFWSNLSHMVSSEIQSLVICHIFSPWYRSCIFLYLAAYLLSSPKKSSDNHDFSLLRFLAYGQPSRTWSKKT